MDSYNGLLGCWINGFESLAFFSLYKLIVDKPKIGG